MYSGLEAEGRELIGNFELVLMIRETGFSLCERIRTHTVGACGGDGLDFTTTANWNVVTPLENHPSCARSP